MSVETNGGRADGSISTSSAGCAADEAAKGAADGTEAGGLAERWRSVTARIAAAALRCGRRAEEVLLVAVTKSATPRQIRHIIELGQRDLAENRVQQLLERAEWLRGPVNQRDPDRAPVPRDASLVRWHMIGTLQRNKIRKTVDHARLIHSVDNLRLAVDLHTEGARRDRPIEVLVQVNVAGETSKQGLNPRALGPFLEQLGTMVNIEVRGLMCMAPLGDDAEQARPVFERCKELFDEQVLTGTAGERFNILSMGMSGDFEVAVECGANLVRVGSAIFGGTGADAAADGAGASDRDDA